MKTVFEKNYDLMVKLGIILEDNSVPSYRKSISSGVMDLVVERNELTDGFNDQKCIGFSIAHYFVQCGDLCSDPIMEILYYPDTNMVEAYSIEMSLPPMYEVVYPLPGKVNVKAKKSQNSFLHSWLNNLVAQGHGVKWEDRSAAA